MAVSLPGRIPHPQPRSPSASKLVATEKQLVTTPSTQHRSSRYALCRVKDESSPMAKSISSRSGVTGYTGFFICKQSGKSHVLRVNGLTADDYFAHPNSARARMIVRVSTIHKWRGARFVRCRVHRSPSFISQNSSRTVLTNRTFANRRTVQVDLCAPLTPC